MVPIYRWTTLAAGALTCFICLQVCAAAVVDRVLTKRSATSYSPYPSPYSEDKRYKTPHKGGITGPAQRRNSRHQSESYDDSFGNIDHGFFDDPFFHDAKSSPKGHGSQEYKPQGSGSRGAHRPSRHRPSSGGGYGQRSSGYGNRGYDDNKDDSGYGDDFKFPDFKFDDHDDGYAPRKDDRREYGSSNKRQYNHPFHSFKVSASYGVKPKKINYGNGPY